ncbi:MAG: hypothetical protein V1936_02970 [Patescibacteria group bacterium]
MDEIKNKIHRFFGRNFHHLQEGLFAITLVFVVGGFLFANLDGAGAQLKAFLGGSQTPQAGLLAANSSLYLPTTSAPTNAVKFSEGEIALWGTNDALIYNLFEQSLIAKIITVAKYILGGVFMVFLGLYVINFLTSGDKEKASKEFDEQILWSFVGFIILALAKPFSQAFMLLRGGQIDLLTNPNTLLASANIVGFTYRSAAHLIEYILGGIALLTMGASAFEMITAVGDEESVKKARSSMAWSALGLLIAGGSALFIDNVFAPAVVVDTQVLSGSDPLYQLSAILQSGQASARILVLNYVKYFQTFIGAGAVLMLFLAGFKMVSAGGEEEIIKKQKKMISWIFMGLSIILVSEAFVNIFLPESASGAIAFDSLTAIQSFSAQIGGFTNFLLAFVGAISVLALIVGALFITTAVANPEQATKGKKILLAAGLGIIITISAYALVNTVLSSSVSIHY